MKIYEIVFSPTGGTERAADYLANAMGKEIEKIDLSRQDFEGCSLDEGSVSIIAMPSFGGRAPKTAIDRLGQIKGNSSKAVVVAVYGNREQEDTIIEMADAAEKCGMEILAGVAAVAEHSIAHQYASGRPDDEDKKQLQEFAQQILEKINTPSKAVPQIPGNRPYKKAGAGIVPKGSAACVKCGICVSKCPVGAIDKSNPQKTNKSICINCMRCIAICPKEARTANPVMVKIVGLALKKACSARKENQLYI